LVCLDTDILIGLLKGEEKAVSLARGLEGTGAAMKTTMVTAYELLKGVVSSSRPEENMLMVRDLLSSLSILTLSYGSCELASGIYSKLRARGQIIGEFDMLIAAMAMCSGETLISRDKHFQLVENLKIETW